jgi:hypothetical protein
VITCPNCGADVPQLTYCVACGVNLASGDAHHHRRFAAAPNESAISLRFASTMLPRLPRSSMAAFNISLLVGVAVVAVIAAIGYYPLALAAGAFIVPLLLIVYIYDVDDYEDEPLRVTAYTIAWGVIAGAAFGFLLRAMFPGVNPLTGESGFESVLKVGVMPLVGGALALAGPLVLLPYRKFNDVLDGATFGATAGATFAGAQVIVQSLDLFSAGLHPGGDAVSWVIRIVLHSVLLPIILGCAVGCCAGAFWLRYRAPVPDRHKLGVAGRPVAALLMAGALLIASSIGLNLNRDIPSLIVEAVLAGVALVWLRLVIHLGLLEELVEASEGPPVRCANCGRETPRATFCGRCGVALRALPKSRDHSPAQPGPPPQQPLPPPPAEPPPPPAPSNPAPPGADGAA